MQSPEGYIAALVFDDPTPNAIVLNRINRQAFEVAARFTDLNDQENTTNDFDHAFSDAGVGGVVDVVR